MLSVDDQEVLALLMQEYSIKEIVLAVAQAADNEADDAADMQLSERAQEFSLGAELLFQLLKNLK